MPTSSSTERLIHYLNTRHNNGENFVYYQGKSFSKELKLPTIEIETIIRVLVKQQRLFLFAIPGGALPSFSFKRHEIPLTKTHTNLSRNLHQKHL